jgi:methylaspartate ammonia-lyase
MEAGILSDAIDVFTPEAAHSEGGAAEVATLRHDMQCVLLQFTRDRPTAGPLAGLTERDAAALAAHLAPMLARRIGGRYVPQRADRALRDAAVWKAFTGRNHAEVMARFGISRRLLYSILSRRRRA